MSEKINNQEIINKIYKIMCTSNAIRIDEDMHSFTYTGNIKSIEDSKLLKCNPSVSIYGQNNVEEYYNNFKILYSNLKIRERKISFSIFLRTAEQVVFTKQFDEKNILDEIKKLELFELTLMTRIYGIKMEQDLIELGGFIFVCKSFINNYLCDKISVENNANEYKAFFEGIDAEIKDETAFLYVLHKYEAADSVFCREQFEEDVKVVINILRYMSGIRDTRVYVDSIEEKSFMKKVITFTNDGKLGFGMNIIHKDRTIIFNDDYYNRKTNGNFYIWNILKKTKRNEFEKRILKAIDWVGISISEELNNIAISEIAFAFESLLKHEQKGVISASIQAQIAEAIAFICGKNITERKEIIRIFKDLYTIRSAVAHGGLKRQSENYYEYLSIFKKTLVILLTEETYKSVSSLENLKVIIDDFKFR